MFCIVLLKHVFFLIHAIKVQSLKPLSLFVFCFALACERTCIKTHSIESTRVIGPENRLFAGRSEHLSARILYRLGQ